ncbi:hypothetical protein COY95_03240, partial [Candidatus Woesearchaeota archaeon CG_4_10_14_0_8_um_filter_47_5]
MALQSKSESEMHQVTWIILTAVKHLQVGKNKLAQFLKGSKSKNIQSISGEAVYGGLMWYDIPTITGFIEQLETIGLIHRKVLRGHPFDYLVFELTEAGKNVLEEKKQITLQSIKEKKPINVGDSEKETLKLVHNGKNVSEIAKERDLAESTIYTHIFRLIVNNYLSGKEVISETIIEQITGVVANFKTIPSVKE